MVDHVLAPGDHTVRKLPKSCDASRTQTGTTLRASRYQPCCEHDQPLMYFCKTCGVPVCGGCAAIGAHRDSTHHDIAAMSDVTEDRKQKSAAEVRKLKEVAQPRLERAIASVDDVSEQLSAQARTARSEIQSAAQQVVQTVEAYKEQLIQEVDDEEEARHKALDLQRDKLKSNLESVKNAVAFSERLEASEAEGSEKLAMLVALEQRAKALNGSDVADEPCRNTNIRFRGRNEDDILEKVKEAVGKVFAAAASAARSHLDQQSVTSFKGEKVVFVLQAADRQGQSLSEGGDNVIATCVMSSATSASVSVRVEDKQDGHYEITAQPEEDGDYSLQISVNGERLPTNATLTCRSLSFDSAECHPDITLSADKRTATRGGLSNGHVTVLGNVGMRRGRHSWHFQIGTYTYWHSLGVVVKPLSGDEATYGQSQSFCANNQHAYVTGGAVCTSSLAPLQENDTVQLNLDCDSHTLHITNLRNRNTAFITNLPDAEYFPYVNMFSVGNSVQISYAS